MGAVPKRQRPRIFFQAAAGQKMTVYLLTEHGLSVVMYMQLCCGLRLAVFATSSERYPSWPKGADCKSAGNAFAGSNPALSTTNILRAHVAQSAERILGKDKVTGSIPVVGSIFVYRTCPTQGLGLQSEGFHFCL